MGHPQPWHAPLTCLGPTQHVKTRCMRGLQARALPAVTCLGPEQRKACGGASRHVPTRNQARPGILQAALLASHICVQCSGI
jgi:hypothetical protein